MIFHLLTKKITNAPALICTAPVVLIKNSRQTNFLSHIAKLKCISFLYFEGF